MRVDRCGFVACRGPSNDASPAGLSDMLQKLSLDKTASVEICGRIARAFDHWDHRDLTLALMAIGEAADLSGLGNAYHNPEHSRNVGVSWINLAQLHNRLADASEAICARSFLLGCCAAFGHDLLHDGTSNEVVDDCGGRRVEPFRLERIAAERVAAILAAAGVSEEEILIARCAILCTDVAHGYPRLEAALAAPARELASDFAPLRKPAALRLTALLRDADLLQSAGLRAGDHDRNTRAVLAERGGAADPAQKAAIAEFLFAKVMRGRFLSDAGQSFQPNLAALIALNAVRLKEPQCATMDLEALARRLDTPVYAKLLQ